MKTVIYSDLFEDEVAEVIREHTHHSTMIFIGSYMFSPACMICDDGIYASGGGYFSEYFNGRRTGNHITAAGLVQALAHKTFTIKAREV